MSSDVQIPSSQHEIIPGKGKSMAEIDETQRRKEAAIDTQKANDENGSPQIKPSDRWTDALKRARVEATMHRDEDASPKKKWWNAHNVAKGLQNADESDVSDVGGEIEDEDSSDDNGRHRRKQLAQIQKGKNDPKIMGRAYFLEMIDPHHRYGSNLRAYHRHWMKHTDNKDNFFHWLDQGEGLNVDLAEQGRSRHSLDSEKVRYLTREQRANYLVKVDEKGLLRWAKNDKKIDTTIEFKDSEEGIVPGTDTDAEGVPPGEEASGKAGSDDDSASSTSGSSAVSGTERADKYVNDQSGIKKVFLISPQAVMNRLLRKTTRKNTWIYVTDTSYRLYVGLKQSGSFQHSSFLHGARVTSAGLITIRHGQLRKLSPLSGHYRCSTKHFRRFLHAMENKGVDMSRVYVSRSYTIMIGMEAIGRVRKVKSKIVDGVEKVVERLENKKKDETDGDDEESESANRTRTNGHGSGASKSDDANKISSGIQGVNLNEDQWRIEE